MKKFIIFTILILSSFILHAEIRLGFSISAESLSKNNLFNSKIKLSKILSEEIFDILNKSKIVSKQDKAIFGGWYPYPENPLMGTFVYFLPNSFENEIPESYKINFNIKKINDYITISKSFEILNSLNLEKELNYLKDEIKPFTGISIKIFFDRVWKLYNPLTQIFRGFMLFSLLKDSEKGKSQLTHLIEMLFYLADDLQNITILHPYDKNPELNKYQLSISFKQNSLINKVFEKPSYSISSFHGLRQFSSSRISFVPSQLKIMLLSFLKRLELKILATPAEIERMKNKINDIFGENPEDALFSFDSIGFFQKNGTLGTFLICSLKKNKISLLQFKEKLNAVLKNSPYASNINIEKRGNNYTVLNVNLKYQENFDGKKHLPNLVNSFIKNLYGIEPEFKIEFIESNGSIMGKLGEIDEEFLKLVADIKPSMVKKAPVFTLTMNPIHLINIILMIKNPQIMKKLSDDSNVDKASINNFTFDIYKENSTLKLIIQIPNSIINKASEIS